MSEGSTRSCLDGGGPASVKPAMAYIGGPTHPTGPSWTWRPRRTARRVRCVRHIRARARGLAAVVLRAVRAAAPRAGVGGDRGGRPRRAHHHAPRARPGQPGVHRERPEHARRRAGDRARALFDDGLERLGELTAGAALGGHARLPARGRAGAQRQPDQRRGAAQRAAGAGGHVQLDVGLGDHRGADRDAPGGARGGRDRGGAAAAEGRVLDGRDDEGPRRRLPRPARAAPAVAGRAGARSAVASPRRRRRPAGGGLRSAGPARTDGSRMASALLRGERVVRVRHHRREVPARRASRARW